MTGRPRKIHPERLREMAAAGMNRKQIAAEMGVSYTAVLQAAVRFGVPFEDGRAERMRVKSRSADEKALAILSLNATGMARRDVAAKLGTTIGAVNGTIDRVMRADLDESGEPRAVVLAGYLKKAM